MRIIDEVEEGSKRDFYDEILLYKEVSTLYRYYSVWISSKCVTYLQKARFILNLKTLECNKTTIERPFRPIEVPSFANFTDSVYLGLSGLIGAGVLENIYQGSPPSGGEAAYYIAPFKVVHIIMHTMNVVILKDGTQDRGQTLNVSQ